MISPPATPPVWKGTHGQLGTRLTDGLCSDDSDSLTNLYRLTGSHVGTVTFCTDTDMGTTGQDGTDFHLLQGISVLIYAFLHDSCSSLRSNHVVGFYQNLTVFVADSFAGETACDTLLQVLDLLFFRR